jgi:hypothetical protein
LQKNVRIPLLSAPILKEMVFQYASAKKREIRTPEAQLPAPSCGDKGRYGETRRHIRRFGTVFKSQTDTV